MIKLIVVVDGCVGVGVEDSGGDGVVLSFWVLFRACCLFGLCEVLAKFVCLGGIDGTRNRWTKSDDDDDTR